MSTTEILFNSPALRSLKRAQLVQLCKRHNIKASGKNTELISRLKGHAVTMPPGSPLNVAIRSEQDSEDDDLDPDDGSEDADVTQRPSEQWELVMEDIPEEESSGSQSGKSGEFGTAGSKCTSARNQRYST